MRCIYCKTVSEGTRGVAHVLPEAVAQNNQVLPPGTVCDPCNQYLGKLDLVLASYPLVALGIQWLRLPGKGGRLRSMVGNVEHDEELNAVHIPVEAPSRDGPGLDPLHVTVLVPRAFDGFRFRRALHHVGLNVVALKRGYDAAMASNLDEVRRYVRYPKSGERWQFAQLPLFDAISGDLKIHLVEWKGTLLVGMRLLSVLFWIDLCNSGLLADFVRREQEKLPALNLVSPSDRLPREGPKQGRVRHRITIYRDR